MLSVTVEQRGRSRDCAGCIGVRSSDRIVAVSSEKCERAITRALSVGGAMRYSTGGVRDYIPNGCGGPDLPQTIPEVRAFQAWYGFGGHVAVSTWENGNVWGSDFRDDGGDIDPSGGSDLPDIYLFAGHGSCESSPGAATDPDFIITCGNFGTPNVVNIGTSSRWGNGSGDLRFMFVDASCPMDLVSLANDWFPVFQGLHMATGHSGNSGADALDSPSRGSQLGARTTGLPFPLSWLYPQQSVGDAWMDAGTIDIQSGCSAVALAVGATEQDAVDRRENERVTDNRAKPAANWAAWKWRTA